MKIELNDHEIQLCNEYNSLGEQEGPFNFKRANELEGLIAAKITAKVWQQNEQKKEAANG